MTDFMASLILSHRVAGSYRIDRIDEADHSIEVDEVSSAMIDDDQIDADGDDQTDADAEIDRYVDALSPNIEIHDSHRRIDHLELAMLHTAAANLDSTPVDLPVWHEFTPGLYRRTIFMPAGTLLTSRIHNTRHPYVVLAGAASVYISGKGVELIEAPHSGITEPGTRRVLYIHRDCIWVTFHPINPDEESVDDIDERLTTIESRIIERHELLDGQTTHELYSALLEEAKNAGLLEEHPHG